MRYKTYEDGLGLDFADIAEAVIDSGEAASTPDALLTQLLSRAGLTENLSPLGPGSHNFTLPATIFDAFAADIPALRRHFEQFFEVVALPGETLLDVFLQPGDILIRRALAEGNLAHTALVVSEQLVSDQALREYGLSAESGSEGSYSQVMEAGPFPHPVREQFFRRMTDQAGRVPYDQMVLRLRSGLMPESVIQSAEEFYPNDPNRYRNPIVRRALHELNRLFFDQDRVVAEFRRATPATIDEARILLEKIWDRNHADKWLALLDKINRQAGRAAHNEVLRLADNALRERLQRAMAGVPAQRISRLGLALSRISNIADFGSTIAELVGTVADAFAASTVTTGALITQGFFMIGGMIASILAGLHELGSISLDSRKVAFVNAYAYYLSDLASGRTPRKQDHSSYYRILDRDSRAVFDRGWTAAERSIQQAIRNEGGRQVAAGFSLLRREHPDPEERKNFLARRIALRYGLRRYIHGWRYDGLHTGTGGGPTLRGETSWQEYDQLNFRSNEFSASTDTFPPNRPYIDSSRSDSIEDIEEKYVEDVAPRDTRFIYMDVGNWGGNSRYFGIIYGDGSGPGIAAVCQYGSSQGADIPGAVARMVQAQTLQRLRSFLTQTNSRISVPSTSQTGRPLPRIKALPGINTGGTIYVLLGDLHLPVWRSGRSLPVPPGILLNQHLLNLPRRTVIRELQTLVLGTLVLGHEQTFDTAEVLVDSPQSWQSYYEQADIFYGYQRGRTAATDLNNFLNMLESLPGRGTAIRLFQMGDLFELWIGLQLQFRHDPRSGTVQFTSRLSAQLINAWISATRTANPIVDRLHRTSNLLNTVWLYGNHDNYLRVITNPRLGAANGYNNTIPRRYMRFSENGIHMEHGHRPDQFNRDGDTRGWQMTQAAFLRREIRNVVSWAVGDRRETFLNHARAACRRYRNDAALPNLRIFAMGHTHSPYMGILSA